MNNFAIFHLEKKKKEFFKIILHPQKQELKAVFLKKLRRRE